MSLVIARRLLHTRPIACSADTLRRAIDYPHEYRRVVASGSPPASNTLANLTAIGDLRKWNKVSTLLACLGCGMCDTSYENKANSCCRVITCIGSKSI